MKAGQACSTPVICIEAQASIPDAARLMREQHVGTLIITEERTGGLVPTGIVTDRDLVLEVLAQELDVGAVTIGDLFCADGLVTVYADDDLEEALRRMREQGIRRLPVVDAYGDLTGILSTDDLLRVISTCLAGLADLVVHQPHLEAKRREL